MEIRDVLSRRQVACDSEASSKKRVLELISEMLSSAAPGKISRTEIFEKLIEREKLGSTGLGHGIAIPHGRLENLEQTTAAFVKLRHGVSFDAADDESVDLFFALLVPQECTDEHLKILALLAEMFHDQSLCERLRSAHDPASLYSLLTNGNARAAVPA